MNGGTPAGGSGASRDEAVLSAYLAALRDGDRRAAFRVIDDAQSAGMPLGHLYVGVFQPALREIGRLWQDNEITVADEHLATAITEAAMAHAFEHAFQWAERRQPRLVAACADKERHEVGLRMLCDLLEMEGWDTTYLGAAVPVQSLVSMVGRIRPEVVALSAGLAPHVPQLRAMITALREQGAGPGPVILAGGRPFLEDPSLALQIGADFTAPDAVAAVELLRQAFPTPA